MIHYRQILISLLLLLAGAHYTNAQVVCCIDSVKAKGRIAESVSDFWDEIVPVEGPYIIVYSTIRNDGIEDVLMYTSPKNNETTFCMETFLQLEFEYQGRKYTNKPVSIVNTDTPLHYNIWNYDFWGIDQEAFVLEPGQAQGEFEFWLNPFNGCELSTLESIHYTEMEKRLKEWNRLYNMLSEIIPSLYIRMYTDILDLRLDYSPDLLKEAWTPTIITAR